MSTIITTMIMVTIKGIINIVTITDMVAMIDNKTKPFANLGLLSQFRTYPYIGIHFAVNAEMELRAALSP